MDGLLNEYDSDGTDGDEDVVHPSTPVAPPLRISHGLSTDHKTNKSIDKTQTQLNTEKFYNDRILHIVQEGLVFEQVETKVAQRKLFEIFQTIENDVQPSKKSLMKCHYSESQKNRLVDHEGRGSCTLCCGAIMTSNLVYWMDSSEPVSQDTPDQGLVSPASELGIEKDSELEVDKIFDLFSSKPTIGVKQTTYYGIPPRIRVNIGHPRGEKIAKLIGLLPRDNDPEISSAEFTKPPYRESGIKRSSKHHLVPPVGENSVPCGFLKPASQIMAIDPTDSQITMMERHLQYSSTRLHDISHKHQDSTRRPELQLESAAESRQISVASPQTRPLSPRDRRNESEDHFEKTREESLRLFESFVQQTVSDDCSIVKVNRDSQCPDCQRRFADSIKLDKHSRSCRGVKRESGLKRAFTPSGEPTGAKDERDMSAMMTCRDCGRSFNRLEGYESHVRVCWKMFSSGGR